MYQYVRLQLLVLLACKLTDVVAQNKSATLQQVVFKDKVLEYNLKAFVNTTDAKIVSVLLEKRDNAYLYKLSKIYFFEEVKEYPTLNWGQWHNRIMVFYSGPELSEVCTISDTTSFTNLVKYIEPALIKRDVYVNGKKVRTVAATLEGLEWVFKVDNGREVWLYDNQGYDSREFPQMPDPK